MVFNADGYKALAKATYALSCELSDAVQDARVNLEPPFGVTKPQFVKFLGELVNLSDNLFLVSGAADQMVERIEKVEGHA
ncbi:hypothetical protein [Neorhizobium sp. NCHU2750]|uniref:hypothetical protein n=1 Tax=Neorhizobium sp. NCHU2750 TaxID=1825976 RepID=UPI000E76E0DB|nr:hypothetical protein NCHU2750_17920 [Neorhizobium sp. NCHU2750]